MIILIIAKGSLDQIIWCMHNFFLIYLFLTEHHQRYPTSTFKASNPVIIYFSLRGNLWP